MKKRLVLALVLVLVVLTLTAAAFVPAKLYCTLDYKPPTGYHFSVFDAHTRVTTQLYQSAPAEQITAPLGDGKPWSVTFGCTPAPIGWWQKLFKH